MSSYSISRSVARGFIVTLTLACIGSSLLAQNGRQYGSPELPTIEQRPDLWVEIQDGIRVFRVAENDTTPADAFSAYHMFTMIYDSLNQVEYLFTECKKNGQRLRLSTWHDEGMVHWPAGPLSDSTRTDPFSISTGDTLSFFRNFTWVDPRSYTQTPTNYYSKDTLAYAVELVNATNNQRLALLDTIGALPNLSPGAPTIFGTLPIMKLVEFAVPSSMNGLTAKIRVRVYAEGSGKYHFVRADDYGTRLSELLNHSETAVYLSLYGGNGSNKLSEPYRSESRFNSANLQIVEHDGSATLKFSTPNDGGSVTIMVYNEKGEYVFTPFESTFVNGASAIEYVFPSSGVYFVVLYHNRQIVDVDKTIIRR